jgi:hypothetical protein
MLLEQFYILRIFCTYFMILAASLTQPVFNRCLQSKMKKAIFVFHKVTYTVILLALENVFIGFIV